MSPEIPFSELLVPSFKGTVETELIGVSKQLRKHKKGRDVFVSVKLNGINSNREKMKETEIFFSGL